MPNEGSRASHGAHAQAHQELRRGQTGRKIPAAAEHRQKIRIGGDVAVRHEQQGVQREGDRDHGGNKGNPDVPGLVSGPLRRAVGNPAAEIRAREAADACDKAVVPADVDNGHAMHAAEKKRHEIAHAVSNEGVQGAGKRKVAEGLALPEKSQHLQESRWRRVAARLRHAPRRLLDEQAHEHGEQQAWEAHDHEGRAPVEHLYEIGAADGADENAAVYAERIDRKRGGALLNREDVGNDRVGRRRASGFADPDAESRHEQLGKVLRRPA